MNFLPFSIFVDALAPEGYAMRAVSPLGSRRGWFKLPAEGLPITLPAEVHDLLQQTLGLAQSQPQTSLRITLHLAPPELAALDWEARWPQPAGETDPFLLRHSLARFFDQHPPKPLPVPKPARLLCILPQVTNLNLAREHDILVAAFEPLVQSGDLIVDWLDDNVTIDSIRTALGTIDYHLLHFAGHGTRNEKGFTLTITDSYGDDDHLTTEHFAGFCRQRPSLRLVVLNACQGGHPLDGAAPALMEQGLPAVVAMHGDIPDSAALKFSSSFYRSLCVGSETGEVDTALIRARAALHDDLGPAEAALPTLFLQTTDGRLWESPPSLDIPPLAPLPDDFVPRPVEREMLVSKLLRANRNQVVAVRGAGGFGKTTLALAVCHDPRIRQRFKDGIVWITLGEKPGDLTPKLADLIQLLDDTQPRYATLEAAKAKLASLLNARDLLLVVDDVWNLAHLNSLPECSRLVTTRNAEALPPEADVLALDAMTVSEAALLLGASLASAPMSLHNLAQRLGEWPLLLKLANGVLRDRIRRGQSVAQAIAWVNTALDKRGLEAFDLTNAETRNQAVSRTLAVSLDLLDAAESERYRALAVFPEDADVPLNLLSTYWGLDDFETEALCDRLWNLSLLLQFDLTGRHLRLHDVVRTYLIHHSGSAESSLHAKLIDAVRPTRWADLPATEIYLWKWLPYHLYFGNGLDELRGLLVNFDYLQAKLDATNIHALITDYAYALHDTGPRLIQAALKLSAHVLDDKTLLAQQLLGRLMTFDDPAVKMLLAQAEQWRGANWFRPLTPCLTPPGGPLVFVLEGHAHSVTSVVVTPDGQYAVSGSRQDIKVWDLNNGELVRSLTPHGLQYISQLALTPDGAYIVATTDISVVEVWRFADGRPLHEFVTYGDNVKGFALSPESRYVLVCHLDRVVAYDLDNGQPTGTIEMTDSIKRLRVTASGLQIGEADVNQVYFGEASLPLAVPSPSGHELIRADYGNVFGVYDRKSGDQMFDLTGHRDIVRAAAFSPNGRLVVSASGDHDLRVWDPGSIQPEPSPPFEFGEPAALSDDGSMLRARLLTGVETVWSVPQRKVMPMADGAGLSAAEDTNRERELKRLRARGRPTKKMMERVIVTQRFVRPDGKRELNVSSDRTVRLFDPESDITIAQFIADSNTGAYTASPNLTALATIGDQGRLIVLKLEDKS